MLATNDHISKFHNFTYTLPLTLSVAKQSQLCEKSLPFLCVVLCINRLLQQNMALQQQFHSLAIQLHGPDDEVAP
jgi:hypothetical protein